VLSNLFTVKAPKQIVDYRVRSALIWSL